LCAIWRCDRLALVQASLAGGRHPSIRAMLADAGAVEADFDDPKAFDNINAPEDYARAAVRRDRSI
jgi:molybdopterin-guanine dinucleotide biosynthesis protein A